MNKTFFKCKIFLAIYRVTSYTWPCFCTLEKINLSNAHVYSCLQVSHCLQVPEKHGHVYVVTLYNSMELHIDPSLDILGIDAWGRSIFVGVDAAARAPVLLTQGCI